MFALWSFWAAQIVQLSSGLADMGSGLGCIGLWYHCLVFVVFQASYSVSNSNFVLSKARCPRNSGQSHEVLKSQQPPISSWSAEIIVHQPGLKLIFQSCSILLLASY